MVTTIEIGKDESNPDKTQYQDVEMASPQKPEPAAFIVISSGTIGHKDPLLLKSLLKTGRCHGKIAKITVLKR